MPQSSDPASLPASEAVPATAIAIDVKRRMVIVMERTEVEVVPGSKFDSGSHPRLGELCPLLRRP
jgi:hypothetical protein